MVAQMKQRDGGSAWEDGANDYAYKKRLRQRVVSWQRDKDWMAVAGRGDQLLWMSGEEEE